MFKIATFIGRRVTGGWHMSDQRFDTEIAATKALNAIDQAVRAVNPEIRWMMRKVVRA